MENRGSFSINEWCHRHGLCRASYYNLQKRGEGPAIMHIGKIVRISEEADARWVAQREDAAACANPAVTDSKPDRKRRVLLEAE
jgi:hypothetical protein